MKISIHIPFFNENPDEKIKPLNKTKLFFLKKSLNSLQTLPIKKDVYVHCHNSFLKNKKLNCKLVHHNLSKDQLSKGYLTWAVRDVMEKQKNKYNFFMYIEYDILFNKNNFNYWLKYNSVLKNQKLNVGFLVLEKGIKDYYSFHLQNKLKEYIDFKNTKYFIVGFPYYCLWIYDQKDFKNFIKTKWWKFKWKGKNFRTFYGITEMSATGWHGLNMDRYTATVIPKIKNNLHPGCFTIHATNNYFYRKEKMKLSGRYLCKYKKDNLFSKSISEYKGESKSKILALKTKFYFRSILRLFR